MGSSSGECVSKSDEQCDCCLMLPCVCVCASGLLNAAVPGALSERSLHRDVKTAYGQALLTDEQRVENVSNVLAATKQSLDLPEVSKLSPDLFMDGRCESSFTICVESPFVMFKL